MDNARGFRLRKSLLFLFVLLASCDSSSSKKQIKNLYYDPRLFFDLDSEVNRVPCAIQGKIPSWLSGTLLRNGPAKFHVGDQQVSYFDGLAMLHAFDFSSDQVLYTNRFIRSEQYYIMMDKKSVNFSGFSQDPCPKLFKEQTRFIPQDMKGIENADVSIQEYADQMVALTEVPLPVLFDTGTLDTLGALHYNDTIPQGQWESAHPLHDPAAGESVNYFVRFSEKCSYVIWRMADHQSARQVIAEIPVQLPAYMHSFALTERYVVLVEFPFVVNPLDLMLNKKAFILNYKWIPDRGTHFYVVERSTGKVAATIKGDPFFAFHHVNAFDQGDKIFIDVVTYLNPDLIESIAVRSTPPMKVEKSQITKMERFTIDISAQKLSRETIFPQILEMPRVAANRTASEYRYCYAHKPLTLQEQAGLHKIDVATKTSLSWAEDGCVPGEPIFVPRPRAEDEDDGAVLSLVLDYTNKRSFLLILDAKKFTEIARAEAPHAIPIGIHGYWKGI